MFACSFRRYGVHACSIVWGWSKIGKVLALKKLIFLWDRDKIYNEHKQYKDTETEAAAKYGKSGVTLAQTHTYSEKKRQWKQQVQRP